MKLFRVTWATLTLVVVATTTAFAVVRDNMTSSAPITFSDGAVATTYDHCGDADLCATIEYKNGEKILIYSEGAAFCQPYEVHFVKLNGSSTEYEFTRALNHDPVTTNVLGTHCGNNRATQMTLDHGLVHLTVDEYNDGSLRFIFSTIAPKD